MATTILLTAIYFLLCSSTCILSITLAFNPVNDGFVLFLTHRDSPHSPFYNHSMTLFDRRLAAAHRSLSRLNHLHLRATLQQGPPEFAPELIPDSTEYVINLYVGTPPTKVNAFIDSGSNLVWIKGLPFFDPTKSFSYTNQSCDSELCNALGSFKTCKGQEPCTYQCVYEDHTRTSGFLSKDKFTFEAPDKSLVDVGFVQFGYSNASSPEFTGKQNGCVGLSRSNLSLIDQLGIKKFSHCMTIPDDQVPGSLMYFGSRAVVYGSQTPILENPDGFYLVKLERINVGDEKIQSSQEIVIDSGTSYSLLDSQLLQQLLDKMRHHMSNPLPSIDGHFDLCFRGTFDDVQKLPSVKFRFAGGGADVELIKETTFQEFPGSIWCFAFLRSPFKDFSVFGNIQMRNLWVGYDLERNVVSFQPAICADF